MKSRVAGLAVGLVFGVVLAWSGMTSPVVIRQALLFQNAYLFLFFASAVAVAAVGLRLIRRRKPRAVCVDCDVAWETERPARRHIVGALVFGLGWGVADACPGPIATQVGQGIGWGVFTMVGVVVGVLLFLRRRQPDTEPATDPVPALAAAVPRGSSLERLTKRGLCSSLANLWAIPDLGGGSWPDRSSATSCGRLSSR